MEMYVSVKSFNPKLQGKAIRIKGFDFEGDRYDRLFLVKEVNGESISVVNCQGEVIEDLHIENFDHSEQALRITVLEEPKNE